MDQNSQGTITIENGKRLLICSSCANQGTVSVLGSTENNSLSIRKYSRKDTQITLSNTSAGTISCGNCNTDAYRINSGTVAIA